MIVNNNIIIELSLNKIATALDIMIIISPIMSTVQKVKTNLLSLFFERNRHKMKEGIVKVIAEDTPSPKSIEINFKYVKKEEIIKVTIKIKVTFFEYLSSIRTKNIIARYIHDIKSLTLIKKGFINSPYSKINSIVLTNKIKL
ncbi:MAG: hypothetical protein VB095_10910 [Anaerovorax sp.]|nr:hypothetical protein [Anaerovorax sp.]